MNTRVTTLRFNANIWVMGITRVLKEKILQNQINKGKAVLIYGARRTGKTTLLKEIQGELQNCHSLLLNCDLDEDRAALTTKSIEAQASVWKNYDVIFIDEAQRKQNIGLVLKIAVDNFPDKNFIVTGSSSLDLSNEVSEPLTGRTFTNHLYPLSLYELQREKNIPQIESEKEDYLRYGLYPEIYTTTNSHEKKQLLRDLARDYLYKDVLEYQDIRKPDIIPKLLKLIAYQIGNEVSFHELANILGIDQQTVYSYIDLLEKAFVILRLPPYSNNLRNEINTKEKVYFLDLGIRNALIGDFNEIQIRNDKGALWENFIILERLKLRHYRDIAGEQYFWRTYSGAEVDLVEARSNELFGYEIKYSDTKRAKAPKAWKEYYKDSHWKLINSSNFTSFVTHE